jgi:hypothetical protein
MTQKLLSPPKKRGPVFDIFTEDSLTAWLNMFTNNYKQATLIAKYIVADANPEPKEESTVLRGLLGKKVEVMTFMDAVMNWYLAREEMEYPKKTEKVEEVSERFTAGDLYGKIR